MTRGPSATMLQLLTASVCAGQEQQHLGSWGGTVTRRSVLGPVPQQRLRLYGALHWADQGISWQELPLPERPPPTRYMSHFPWVTAGTRQVLSYCIQATARWQNNMDTLKATQAHRGQSLVQHLIHNLEPCTRTANSRACTAHTYLTHTFAMCRFNSCSFCSPDTMRRPPNAPFISLRVPLLRLAKLKSGSPSAMPCLHRHKEQQHRSGQRSMLRFPTP